MALPRKQTGDNSRQSVSSLVSVTKLSDHRCCCGPPGGWVRIASLFFLRHFRSFYCLFFIAKAVHVYFRNFRKSPPPIPEGKRVLPFRCVAVGVCELPVIHV